MTASTLVVGTGYTGLRLLRRLPADTGRGLSRSVAAGAGDFCIDKLNLDSPGTAAELSLPADYAIVYTVPPARDAEHDRRLEALLAALTPAPRRFVYLSTTGVYGDRQGETVTETDPPRPETARARRRVAAENALGRWSKNSATEIVILRVPGIYGPDRVMIDRVRSREPLIQDSEANPGNRIHVEDLVTACLAGLNSETPAGIYNLGDGDLRSSTWFSETVAKLLGLPPPPTLSRHEAQTRFSERRLSFLNESRRIDTQKMRRTLGVTPRYADAADGIRASLTEMGLLA
ncbi:MAG: NAD-dependent epimerase/dehydratase family protein [Pseudomonadota bacterium]